MLGLEADGVEAIGDGETAEQEIVDCSQFWFSSLPSPTQLRLTNPFVATLSLVIRRVSLSLLSLSR